MGTLIYGNIEVEFEDRSLVHLQTVIGSKFRRGESFFLSWNGPAGDGTARTSLWLHPGIPLLFTYPEDTNTSINRSWVDALTVSANSSQGLLLTTEPPETPGRLRAVDY